MGEAFAVGGGHRVGELADELVGVVGLHRPGGQQRGQLGGVGEPFVDDVDEVVLLDGVQHLDEAGVAEQGGRAGRRQYGAGPGVVGGQQVDADRAAQFLVDGPPAAEAVQPGDALLQAVAPGEFVAAVDVGGGRNGLGTCPPAVLALGVLGLLGARALGLLGLRRSVVRGLVRLGGRRLVAAVVGHVDGSRATFRHRRSCLPIRCAKPASSPQSRQLCPHSGAMHDTRSPGMVVRPCAHSATEPSTDHADQAVDLFDAHLLRRDEEDAQEDDATADQCGQ